MHAFGEELERLEREGLKRKRRTIDGPQGTYVQSEGRPYTSFCSNDYLGLANHPALIEAVCRGAKQYGVGAGASHLLLGHALAHEKAERALAEFVRLPDALLYSTGYMANIGTVPVLVGRHDAVFCDKLNHASLNEAAILSRARLYRYPHLDMDALEALLSRSKEKRKVVVTDAVFSMDGDIAPVPDLVELCDRHDALLLLDDAHGFGVLGDGRGVLSHFGIQSSRVVYMGTLGKAAGVAGAFVAGDANLIDMLVQRSKSYVYTTAQPPLLAEAVMASLELIGSESWRRRHLAELVDRLKGHLGYALMPSITPIQPFVVGENNACLKLSEKLMASGMIVPAIRPPTVLKGSARLRISLSASHTFDEVDRLAMVLKQ